MQQELETGADLNLYWISEHRLSYGWTSRRDPRRKERHFVETISHLEYLNVRPLHMKCYSCI